MLETIALGLIAGYCIWRLYRSFDKPPKMPSNKIRLVSPDTGEVLEMQLVPQTAVKPKEGWDDDRFLISAKFVFQKVLAAFALGHLKELKEALSPSVYRVFEQEILARQDHKQKMEFSLICFDSAKIIHKTPDHTEVTVQFQTEQINLLKDALGHVIEGDEMTVAVMQDTWVFRRVDKESWQITATQSRMAPCVKS